MTTQTFARLPGFEPTVAKVEGDEGFFTYVPETVGSDVQGKMPDNYNVEVGDLVVSFGWRDGYLLGYPSFFTQNSGVTDLYLVSAASGTGTDDFDTTGTFTAKKVKSVRIPRRSNQRRLLRDDIKYQLVPFIRQPTDNFTYRYRDNAVAAFSPPAFKYETKRVAKSDLESWTPFDIVYSYEDSGETKYTTSGVTGQSSAGFSADYFDGEEGIVYLVDIANTTYTKADVDALYQLNAQKYVLVDEEGNETLSTTGVSPDAFAYKEGQTSVTTRSPAGIESATIGQQVHQTSYSLLRRMTTMTGLLHPMASAGGAAQQHIGAFVQGLSFLYPVIAFNEADNFTFIEIRYCFLYAERVRLDRYQEEHRAHPMAAELTDRYATDDLDGVIFDGFDDKTTIWGLSENAAGVIYCSGQDVGDNEFQKNREPLTLSGSPLYNIVRHSNGGSYHAPSGEEQSVGESNPLITSFQPIITGGAGEGADIFTMANSSRPWGQGPWAAGYSYAYLDSQYTFQRIEWRYYYYTDVTLIGDNPWEWGYAPTYSGWTTLSPMSRDDGDGVISKSGIINVSLPPEIGAMTTRLWGLSARAVVTKISDGLTYYQNANIQCIADTNYASVPYPYAVRQLRLPDGSEFQGFKGVISETQKNYPAPVWLDATGSTVVDNVVIDGNRITFDVSSTLRKLLDPDEIVGGWSYRNSQGTPTDPRYGAGNTSLRGTLVTMHDKNTDEWYWLFFGNNNWRTSRSEYPVSNSWYNQSGTSTRTLAMVLPNMDNCDLFVTVRHTEKIFSTNYGHNIYENEWPHYEKWQINPETGAVTQIVTLD